MGKNYHIQVIPKDKYESAQDFKFWYDLVKKYPPLDKDTERFYLEVIHTGKGADPALSLLGLIDGPREYSKTERIEYRQHFIASNTRLVNSRVLKHRKYNDALTMPLISFGFEGLIKGVDKFELKYNTRFSTYSIIWIDHFIKKGLEFLLEEVRIRKKSKNANLKHTKIKNFITDVGDENESLENNDDYMSFETTDTIAYINKTEYENFIEQLAATNDDIFTPKISIDELLHDETDTEILVNDEGLQEVEDTEIVDIVQGALHLLDEPEALIVGCLWGLYNTPVLTYRHLSKKFNKSITAIKKVEQNAYKKLYAFLYQYRHLTDL